MNKLKVSLYVVGIVACIIGLVMTVLGTATAVVGWTLVAVLFLVEIGLFFANKQTKSN